MSDLTASEKQKLELLFHMKQGFLLNFSNKGLQEFIAKSVGIDVNSEKYRSKSGSKANRLRRIWSIEPNFVVAKLLFDLCQYWKESKEGNPTVVSLEDQALYIDGLNICKRLVNSIKAEELLHSNRATI